MKLNLKMWVIKGSLLRNRKFFSCDHLIGMRAKGAPKKIN